LGCAAVSGAGAESGGVEGTGVEGAGVEGGGVAGGYPECLAGHYGRNGIMRMCRKSGRLNT
jgi:hypothetical protein